MAENESTDIESKIRKFLESKKVTVKDQYLIHAGMAQDLLQEIRFPEEEADLEDDEIDTEEEPEEPEEPEKVDKPPKAKKKVGGTRKIGRPKKKTNDDEDF